MTGTLSSTKVTDFPVIQEQGMKPVRCPAVGTSDITHRYISKQLLNNEILPASQRTVFCSLCSLCKTTEESSDHHAPERRMGALWLVFTSCFEKDGCFCSGWALGRMALYVNGIFFFFLAGFGIVLTRAMINVKAPRAAYRSTFLMLEYYSMLWYCRSQEL